MDTQPLATLVDVGLPRAQRLETLLLSKVDAFCNRWLQEDAFGSSSALLLEWQVDNFGVVGTTYLLRLLKVYKPDEAFERRATLHISAMDSEDADEWRRRRFFFKER